ncbi:MAG: DUF971 domain-containing protein [Anaerolineae bacterium]|nr:DUF971 domain-containing protein [Anaerolineae bacterium]
MRTSIRPTNIDVDRDAGEMRITWHDGRTCAYPLANLRAACPCAGCRGHEKMGREFDPVHILALQPERAYGLEQVEVVGNYALQFFWDDGHHTGIYTWEYLYRLCPPEDAAA